MRPLKIGLAALAGFAALMFAVHSLRCGMIPAGDPLKARMLSLAEYAQIAYGPVSTLNGAEERRAEMRRGAREVGERHPWLSGKMYVLAAGDRDDTSELSPFVLVCAEKPEPRCQAWSVSHRSITLTEEQTKFIMGRGIVFHFGSR